MLKYLLEDNCSAVIRPSGTEPKLKVYISVSAKTKAEAQEVERKVTGDVERVMGTGIVAFLLGTWLY